VAIHAGLAAGGTECSKASHGSDAGAASPQNAHANELETLSDRPEFEPQLGGEHPPLARGEDSAVLQRQLLFLERLILLLNDGGKLTQSRKEYRAQFSSVSIRAIRNKRWIAARKT